MGVTSYAQKAARLGMKKRIAVYNGVAVRSLKWYQAGDYYPNHKQLLAQTVREHVSEGDTVTTVGGGYGVVETHAAREGATVFTYEAAAEMVSTILETARLNGVDIYPIHATVGRVRDAYGSTAGAMNYEAEELHGDVLVLDCEGAELDILPRSDFETVIVETHPMYGAGTADVRKLMAGDTEIVGEDPVDGHVVIRNGE